MWHQTFNMCSLTIQMYNLNINMCSRVIKIENVKMNRWQMKFISLFWKTNH
jgi:hypothetical protein